jgi:hypothetical protein
MSTGKKLLIAIVSVIILFTVIGSFSKTEKQKTEKVQIGINQVLHTNYFDVTVNDVKVVSSVNTGNEFVNLPHEKGMGYLIVNTTFKNTDTESRMLTDGSVFINYNGKEYKFDKTETIMLEGWGASLKQINPLTSITTNLVYKIPAEIRGVMHYLPGRSDNDVRIYIGEIAD